MLDATAPSAPHTLSDHGRTIAGGGNHPFLLNSPDAVYVVLTGSVDVFSVDIEGGAPAGIRLHLFRAREGDGVFGMAAGITPARLGLLAVPTVGTTMLELSRARLKDLARTPAARPQVISILESFLTRPAGSLAQSIPSRSLSLAPGPPVTLQVGQVAMAARNVVWVRLKEGQCSFGASDLTFASSIGLFPLAHGTWLKAVEPATLEAFETATFMDEDPEWEAFDRYCARLLEVVQRRRQWYMDQEVTRMREAQATDERLLAEAFSELAKVIGREQVEEGFLSDEQQPLMAACRMVGKAAGVQFVATPPTRTPRYRQDPVGAIARASRVRVRRVLLEHDWWKKDVGPVLGFLDAELRPVAILPAARGTFQMVDPRDSTVRVIDATRAARLAPHAFSFYRSLPEHPLKARDLLTFAFRGTRQDMIWAVVCLFLGGLLATVTPVVTGMIFDTVIPGAERLQLLQIIIGLGVASLAGSMFGLVQSIALLRLEERAESSLQAAVWDRLLNLPVPFFKRYSSGDLASRAMGISSLRQALTSVAVTSVLGVVMSIFNLVLLFVYDAGLASVAIGLVLILTVMSAISSRLQLRFQREVSAVQGRISGVLLQLITGISKIRVAGVEDRAFAVWARQFAQQRKLSYRARATANALATFDALYPVAASMLLYACVIWMPGTRLSTGSFMAFTAAFASFVAAFTSLNSAAVSLFAAWPSYERGKPILEAVPEVTEARNDPGELTGELELSHVNFRYTPDGPPILQDLTLQVKAGEYVALVGPSGSGKSTLLRLLLGFEEPEAGSIFYDHQDLAGLDLQGVRSQIGVVLQNGRLMAGDIYTNIVGASMLTLDDAWEAATLAGLAEDIRQMPMGMHTVISEGGGNFSGGQKQRLLIARAIVTRPRILLFDEATSALDNTTQAAVTASLEALKATRIVIAHRLTTIMGAHRICVVEKGRIVQSGSYGELMDVAGPFQDLVRRQVI